MAWSSSTASTNYYALAITVCTRSIVLFLLVACKLACELQQTNAVTVHNGNSVPSKIKQTEVLQSGTGTNTHLFLTKL